LKAVDGYDLTCMPFVIQFESVTVTGDGVLDTLKAVSKLVLKTLA